MLYRVAAAADVADSANDLGVLEDSLLADANLAFAGFAKSREHRQQRGLARAVAAEQTEDLGTVER